MTTFARFPLTAQLDTEGGFPLKPPCNPPPNPPSSTLYRHLHRLAATFRCHPTRAERHLWELLRGKQTTYRFRRQHILAGYIVDFWCPKLKMAVEIDGPFHHTRAGKRRADVRDETLFYAGAKQILHFHESLPVNEIFRQIIEAQPRAESTGQQTISLRIPQPFPPQNVQAMYRPEIIRERDPKLSEVLAERNPQLADLLFELTGRKRMA